MAIRVFQFNSKFLLKLTNKKITRVEILILEIKDKFSDMLTVDISAALLSENSLIGDQV